MDCVERFTSVAVTPAGVTSTSRTSTGASPEATVAAAVSCAGV